MGKNRIATILLSAGLLAGGLGVMHHSVQKENNQVKNVRLLTNNQNKATFGCVINGNDNLALTNKDGQTSSYLSVGQMLKLGQTQGNKTFVTVEETGVSGYINNSNIKYITSGVNDSMTRMNRKGFVINVTTSVHLRSEATMNSNIIENLSNNTNLTITGQQGNWLRVNVNGVKGFIFDEYVAEGSTSNITSGNIISNTSTTTENTPVVNNNSSNTDGNIVNIPLKVSPVANNSSNTNINNSSNTIKSSSSSVKTTTNTSSSSSISHNSKNSTNKTTSTSNNTQTKSTAVNHSTGNITSGTTNTKPSTSNNTPAKTAPVSHNTGNTTSGTTNTKPSTSNNTPAKTAPVSHNNGNTTSGNTNTKPSTSNNTPAKTAPVSHNNGNTTSGNTNTKPSTSNNTPTKTAPVSHNNGNTTSGNTNSTPANNTPAKTAPVSHNNGNTTSGNTNTKPSTSNNTPAKTAPVSHNNGNTTSGNTNSTPANNTPAKTAPVSHNNGNTTSGNTNSTPANNTPGNNNSGTNNNNNNNTPSKANPVINPNQSPNTGSNSAKNTYNNVPYNTTLTKYVANELKEYLGYRPNLTKSQLSNVTTQLTNAINPKAAATMFEFLNVNQYRNVNEATLASELNGKGIFSGQAQTFISAAKEYNIDPIYFVSQCILETHWGTSEFSNGMTVNEVLSPNGKTIIHLANPVTVYNVCGAREPIHDNSLPAGINTTDLATTSYAYNNGWTSVSAAINGAAKLLSEGYVHNTYIPQNTPYEIRYINAPAGDMWHQYSPDITYAQTLGVLINQLKSAYSSNDRFTFSIPQFQNSSNNTSNTNAQ